MSLLSFESIRKDYIPVFMNHLLFAAVKPGMDGEPCANASGNSVGYCMEMVEPNHILIKSSFELVDDSAWVYPIFDVRLQKPQAVFRQGFGLGGPSGFLSPDEVIAQKIIYSYGMLVLKYEDGYMAFYGDSHTQYNNRFDIRADFREENPVFRLSAGFAVEHTARGGELPGIHLFFDECLETVLAHVAKAIAAPLSPPVPETPAYNWCSWYYYYNNFSYDQLEAFLKGLNALDPKVPIKYVQIDAGYFPSAGDWLEPNSLWPDGLKRAFDLIRSYGYLPGIWIAPFMVGSRSRLFSEHSGWMLKAADQSYVTEWKWYNEPKVWGYQDEEYYVLDTSVPEAMAYLRQVFKTLREWGAEFFKTDFMLWGIQPSHKVLRHAPGQTSVAYYRELMTMIREEIKDSYWLGCIAPFLPSLGFVNGMRIAGDVGAQWNGEGFGPEGMIGELIADNYFNGIYWQNDPDAVILRDYHVFLKDHEIKALALLQAMSGGMVYTSDELGRIASDRLDLFRLIEPDVIRKPRLPFITKQSKVLVLHQAIDACRHAILLFNPGERDETFYYKMIDVTGEEALFTRDFYGGAVSEGKEALIGGVLKAHDCVLLLAHKEQPVTQEIRNLWKW